MQITRTITVRFQERLEWYDFVPPNETSIFDICRIDGPLRSPLAHGLLRKKIVSTKCERSPRLFASQSDTEDGIIKFSLLREGGKEGRGYTRVSYHVMRKRSRRSQLLSTAEWMVDKRGNPKPNTPLTWSTNVKLDTFMRPVI